MNIKGAYLPNWLAVFLFGFLLLMIYLVIDPVNQAVNGTIMSIFGPIIENIRAALALDVV